MRRNRRGMSRGHEFGGSGEDSFVAVVVTKLTGALLFILLLTMVIMALLPKAVDLPADGSAAEGEPAPLRIATPEVLPEAIAGRPYRVALAAEGGAGDRHWSVDGELPEGLTLDPESGLIQGTPKRGTPEPVGLVVRVGDGSSLDARPTQLVVYQPDRPLTKPSAWKPGLPPIPWDEWMDHGFGFLVLGLVHLVGLNAVGTLQRRAGSSEPASGTPIRFRLYRGLIWLATLAAVAGLAAWIALAPG